jgi:hypothetical protein
MKVTKAKRKAPYQRNRYLMVDIDPSYEIDVFASHDDECGGGRSFYVDVCRHIEMASDISDLTFYISTRTPASP